MQEGVLFSSMSKPPICTAQAAVNWMRIQYAAKYAFHAYQSYQIHLNDSLLQKWILQRFHVEINSNDQCNELK